MRSLTAVLAAALVLLPAAPAWAANQAPVAVDDAVNVRNVALPNAVDALANDSDPDGDPLVYTAVTPATKGTAYIYTNGKLYYQPVQFATGTDSFTYTVSDGQGNTATGTVTVTLWSDLPAPGGLTIGSAAPGTAALSWPAATGAAQYQIFRNTLLVQTTSGLTWTDTGLLDDRQYQYTVAAVNGGGFAGQQSTPVYRQRQPTAPAGLAVDVTADPTTLSVTWSTGGNTGPWNVYRDGALVTSSSGPSFTDTGLVTGREYGYQVQLVPPSTATSFNPPSALSPVVRGIPGLTAIGRVFQDLGGASGALGPVTAAETAIPGGRQETHQNGLIVQKDGAAPLAVMTPISTAYVSAGGPTGSLGFPVTEQEADQDRGIGVGQIFEYGSIWYSPSVTPTAVVVPEIIDDGYAASGWVDGPLGYPSTRMLTRPGGFMQTFEGGGVWWSAAAGSHAVTVSSGFWDAWGRNGYEAGRMRYPTTDYLCVLRNGGCFQEFEGGSVYSSIDNGVHAVFAPYEDVWARNGWEDGRLGYPTGDEICGRAAGGCYQAFQGGTIHWSPASGIHAVFAPYAGVWAGSGSDAGRMGYPLADEVCGLVRGGCYQWFQGGSIYWSPGSGIHAVFAPYREVWARAGWEAGRLGYPTTEEICGQARGGCYQAFQGGSINWTPATGMRIG